MGGALGCCAAAEDEFNPDGSPKEAQTKEQKAGDPAELRKCVREMDAAMADVLLKRMLKAQINSLSRQAETGSPEDAAWSALHFAAATGSTQLVRKLILFGANINIKNGQGKTPLRLAAEAGKRSVCAYLIKKGANVNLADKQGVTPLLAAMAAGSRRIASLMLSNAAATLNVTTMSSATKDSAALLAASNGWWDCLETILSRLVAAPPAPDKGQKPIVPAGKVLNAPNAGGETVLGWVLKFGSNPAVLPPAQLTKLVTHLLEKGASVTIPSFKDRVPALHLAAATGVKTVYDAVKRKLSDVAAGNPAKLTGLLKAPDACKRTALHFAAATGRQDICTDLIAEGLSVQAVDIEGNMPIHHALQQGQPDTGFMLLDKAETTDAKVGCLMKYNRRGVTPYHMALGALGTPAAQVAAVKLIAMVGAEKALLPVKDKVGDGPLHVAIRGHQALAVKALLKLPGCDVNKPNLKGESPLARCLSCVTAKTGDKLDAPIFDALLKAGAKAEAANPATSPQLALCRISIKSFAEKALKALQQLAPGGKLDWNIKDEQGLSPLMVAAQSDNDYMCAYLIEKAGVDVNEPLKATKQTALMLAAKEHRGNAVKALLNRNADVDAKDASGFTALDHCLMKDGVDSITAATLLLAKGARCETTFADDSGETLLHRAIRYGAHEFVAEWAKAGGNLGFQASYKGDKKKAGKDGEKAAGAESRMGSDTMKASPAVIDNGLGGEEEEEVEEEEDEGEIESTATSAATTPSPTRKKSARSTAIGEATEEDGGAALAAAAAVAASGAADDDDDSAETWSPAAAPVVRKKVYRRYRDERWVEDFYADVAEAADQGYRYDADEAARFNSAAAAAGGDADDVCDDSDSEDEEEAEMDMLCDFLQGEMMDDLIYDDASPLYSLADKLQARLTQEVAAAAAGEGGQSEQDDGFEYALCDDVVDEEVCGLFGGKRDQARAALRSMRHPPGGVGSGVYGVDDDGDDSSLNGRLFSGAFGGRQQPAHRLGAAGPVAEGLMDKMNAAKAQLSAKVSPSASPAASGASGSAAASPSGARSGSARVTGSNLKVQPSDASSSEAEATPKYTPKQGGLLGSFASSVSKKASNAGSDAGKKVTAFLVREKKITVTDPYFLENYKGTPKYMQVANANAERASEDALKKLADQVEERLVKGYKPVAEPLLPRQALMLRNKELWDLSASPRETPLKPGQWKKLIAQAVIDRRRGRIPGPSSMPMYGTTPLILAVRLGRVACVRELLQHAVFTLNKADGHGMTPLSYAMLALARDKANVVFQQLADMLLAALPNVNATAGVTNPAVLATLMQDQSRLAHMVLRCDTPISRWDNEALVAEYNKTKKMPKSFKAFQRSNVHQINNTLVFLPDIPTYLRGQYDKVVNRCQSVVSVAHCAVMTKNYDMVKFVLDLGADVNHLGKPPKELAPKSNKQVDAEEKAAAKTKAALDAQNASKKENGGELPPTDSLVAKLKRVGEMIMAIEIPGITRPHPHLMPITLAARLGLAEITQLLIKRGANVDGYPGGRKSPLIEALGYARRNYTNTNWDAKKPNWSKIESQIDDVPDMSNLLTAKMAKSKARAAYTALVDPAAMAMKAIAAAAKAVVTFLLTMRKRPVSHHDPALAAAHVLLLNRCALKTSDAQTKILLRDIMDNKLYGYLGLAKTPGDGWVDKVLTSTRPVTDGKGKIVCVPELKDEWYTKMQEEQKSWKAFFKFKGRFFTNVENSYFLSGVEDMVAISGYKSDLNKRLEAETARKKVAKQLEEKEREEAEARAKKQQDAGKAPATGVADRDERAKKGAAALKKNGGVGQALQVLERSVAKLAPEYYKNAQAQLDALEKSTKKQTDQIKKGVWLDENVRVESLDKGAAAIEGMSEQAEAAFSSLLDGGSLTEMLSGAGESVAEWAMSKAAEAVCAKSQQVVDKVAKDLAARGAAAAGSGGAAAADGAGGGGSWNAACAKPGSPTEDQKKSFVEKKSTALQEIKDEAKGAITDALKDMFGVDDLEDSLNDLKDGLLSGDFDKVRGAVEGVVEFVESVFSGDAFGDGMSLEDFEFFANLARMDLDLDFCLSDLAEVGAGFQELLEIVGIDDLMNA